MVTLPPQKEDQAGFEAFMGRYLPGLAAERAAVQHLNTDDVLKELEIRNMDNKEF